MRALARPRAIWRARRADAPAARSAASLGSGLARIWREASRSRTASARFALSDASKASTAWCEAPPSAETGAEAMRASASVRAERARVEAHQKAPVHSRGQGAHSRWQRHRHGLFAAWKLSDAAHCALLLAGRDRRTCGLAGARQQRSLAGPCRARCRPRHGWGAARARGRPRGPLAPPGQGASGMGPAPPSRRRERGAGDGHCAALPLTLLLRLPPDAAAGPSPPNSCILAKGCATGI